MNNPVNKTGRNLEEDYQPDQLPEIDYSNSNTPSLNGGNVGPNYPYGTPVESVGDILNNSQPAIGKNITHKRKNTMTSGKLITTSFILGIIFAILIIIFIQNN